MPGFTGPAPKPDSERVRRNLLPGWVELPVEYTGDYPSWPLQNVPSARELELWESHWRLPQAAMWVRQGILYTLARYITIMADLEKGGVGYVSVASTNMYAEMRQMENALGLSSAALARLRWEVAPRDEVGDKRDQSSSRSTRGRLKAVDPSVANK